MFFFAYIYLSVPSDSALVVPIPPKLRSHDFANAKHLCLKSIHASIIEFYPKFLDIQIFCSNFAPQSCMH